MAQHLKSRVLLSETLLADVCFKLLSFPFHLSKSLKTLRAFTSRVIAGAVEKVLPRVSY